ncbi:PDZ domain-containing protein [Paraflavitalea soli]|uniref:PDZ domain-containing protein n=1 Tax=Paraflavitalea soli TaxID=2315862 RepID=A0A3B7MRM1_9BACT|nr:PDZ domain-containing protein [Paraflavitalea soli]AXY77184.1 PDZ domain-containing protein [Paraflavitalea soli]
MRRYFLPLTGLAAMVLLLNQPVAAQDEKSSDKTKEKIKQYDEIIIRKKSDKDGKVTVEIKDGEVTVNGKPLDDYEDENLSVRKRKSGAIVGNISPFRSNGGNWSFNSDNMNFDSFIKEGKTAFLGVATDDGKEGARIDEVTKGSPAEKAGLKKGDVITKIGDQGVFSQDDVAKEVKKHKPEEKLTITYKRDGKEQKTTATLGKRSEAAALAFGNADGFAAPHIQPMPNFNFNWDDNGSGPRVLYGGRPRLGIKAQDTEDGKGVKVLDVDDESVAGKAGIKEDDIITEFNGKAVNSADELAAAARDAKEKPSVTVKLTRDGKAQTVELKTPKKLKTANL